MRYRPEIDGLRAVAVIPVILFHAGFKLFGGGFVGVDVFFVISGYLITSIMLSELDAGSFSIVKFYERRARRILPAMFFVMTACLPFAWLWLVPRDLKDFSQSLVAVSTFASNILFWRASGYFETAAELKPLLHTWSLAVEEQFYVVFPIFLLLIWRLGRIWMITLTAIVAVSSLALAEWASTSAPVAAYFLLPTRGWELLIGALVGFYSANSDENSRSKLICELLAWIGVLLLSYAIFAFNSQTPFPGLYALAPTLGTALIILCANRRTTVGKILGQEIVVGLGLISYGAYLWHQPLFAFARNRSLSEPSQLEFATLSLASLALAYFSWRYIETPFRNGNKINRKQIFLFGAIGSFCFIALGLTGHFNSGFERRYSLPKSIENSFRTTEKSKECFDKDLIHTRDDWFCSIGTQTERPSFIAFGDSHALSLLDTFDHAAKESNQHGIFTGASGCTPFLGIYALRNDQARRNCYELNKRVLGYAVANSINKVFLIGRWTYYTEGGYGGNNFSYIGLTKSERASRENSRLAFVSGLKKTVDAYKQIGVRLFLISEIPQQKFDVKDLYYKLYNSDTDLFNSLIERHSVQKEEHARLQAFVMDQFSPLEEAGSIRLISFDNALCRTTICLIGSPDKSYYTDDNHLSIEGGNILVNELKPYLSTKF